MAAETGSGKTGAFCLPIIQIVWETLKDLADGKGKSIGNGVTSELPWKMSFFDRGDALAVTPDGLRCQSRDFQKWHGCRATTGVKGLNFIYFFKNSISVNCVSVLRSRKILFRSNCH